MTTSLLKGSYSTRIASNVGKPQNKRNTKQIELPDTFTEWSIWDNTNADVAAVFRKDGVAAVKNEILFFM